MKKVYAEAKMEIINFADDEVIVASGVPTFTQPETEEDELPWVPA